MQYRCAMAELELLLSEFPHERNSATTQRLKELLSDLCAQQQQHRPRARSRQRRHNHGRQHADDAKVQQEQQLLPAPTEGLLDPGCPAVAFRGTAFTQYRFQHQRGPFARLTCLTSYVPGHSVSSIACCLPLKDDATASATLLSAFAGQVRQAERCTLGEAPVVPAPPRLDEQVIDACLTSTSAQTSPALPPAALRQQGNEAADGAAAEGPSDWQGRSVEADAADAFSGAAAWFAPQRNAPVDSDAAPVQRSDTSGTCASEQPAHGTDAHVQGQAPSFRAYLNSSWNRWLRRPVPPRRLQPYRPDAGAAHARQCSWGTSSRQPSSQLVTPSPPTSLDSVPSVSEPLDAPRDHTAQLSGTGPLASVDGSNASQPGGEYVAARQHAFTAAQPADIDALRHAQLAAADAPDFVAGDGLHDSHGGTEAPQQRALAHSSSPPGPPLVRRAGTDSAADAQGSVRVVRARLLTRHDDEEPGGTFEVDVRTRVPFNARYAVQPEQAVGLLGNLNAAVGNAAGAPAHDVALGVPVPSQAPYGALDIQQDRRRTASAPLSSSAPSAMSAGCLLNHTRVSNRTATDMPAGGREADVPHVHHSLNTPESAGLPCPASPPPLPEGGTHCADGTQCTTRAAGMTARHASVEGDLAAGGSPEAMSLAEADSDHISHGGAESHVDTEPDDDPDVDAGASGPAAAFLRDVQGGDDGASDAGMTTGSDDGDGAQTHSAMLAGFFQEVWAEEHADRAAHADIEEAADICSYLYGHVRTSHTCNTTRLCAGMCVEVLRH